MGISNTWMTTDIINILCAIIQIIIAILVFFYTRKVDRIAKENQRRHEHQSMVERTITAYNDVYRQAIMHLELIGTESDIYQDILRIRNEKPRKHRNYLSDPEMKKYKQFVMQIEAFGKGFLLSGSGDFDINAPEDEGSRLYDWKTFCKIFGRDFKNNALPRLNGYYNATSCKIPAGIQYLADQLGYTWVDESKELQCIQERKGTSVQENAPKEHLKKRAEQHPQEGTKERTEEKPKKRKPRKKKYYPT